MIINAVFVKTTSEVMFSRNKTDYRISLDESVSISGGWENPNIEGDMGNCVEIQLEEDFLSESFYQVTRFEEDSGFVENYLKGVYGQYVINKESNLEFFSELIINYEDIENYILYDEYEVDDKDVRISDLLVYNSDLEATIDRLEHEVSFLKDELYTLQ